MPNRSSSMVQFMGLFDSPVHLDMCPHSNSGVDQTSQLTHLKMWPSSEPSGSDVV